MKDNKLHGGALFRANREIICEMASRKGRRVVVERGEIVEFRYPVEANFRTRDELYLYLKEERFLEAFDYYGEVLDVIRFRNQNTMAQILDAKLYSTPDSQEERSE